jgi:hypothetical protein
MRSQPFSDLFRRPFRHLKLHWLKRRPKKRPSSRYEYSPYSSHQKKEVKPRPRLRSGRGTSHSAISGNRTFISLGDVKADENFTVRDLPSCPTRQPGISIRTSQRWIHATPSREVYRIPYYDKLGNNTGTTLARWRCFPEQMISTSVSTVFSRIKQYALRHNKMHIVERNQERLLKVSFLYATTGNSYLWDRTLHFTRNLEKLGPLIHKYMLRFLCKADDYIRFVYNHVCSQAKWLLFRAERPRDKSAPHLLKNLSKEWFFPGTMNYVKDHCVRSIAKAMEPLRARYVAIRSP